MYKYRATYFTIFATLIVCAVTLPHTVFAQSTQSNTFVSLANYGSGNKISQAFGSSSLSGYLNALFTLAISFGAIAAVLRLAYAGYMYMGAADMWGNKQKAREIMGNAIVGLLLLLSVWLILHQIDPRILQLNFLNNIQAAPQIQNTQQQTQPTP